MSRASSPAIAALLSFVLPGLGHVRLGRARRGLMLALPTGLALAGVVILALGGPGAILGALLQPSVLVALLVLDLLILATRAVAIVDSYVTAQRLAVVGVPYRPISVALVAVLLAGTLAVHGVIAAVGYDAYQTVTSVFVEGPSNGEWAIPPPSATASPTPYDPGPGVAPPPFLPNPEPSPTAVPDWAADGRLDLLLIGSDAGPGRWSLRTDTMIVLSVDVRTAHAALFGIPRNLIGVPLAPEDAKAFPNGRYPGLMNSLYVYAMGHPKQFPGGDAAGFRAVSGAIQELLGLRLDGAVVINLNGFVKLVNALGGLWIDVPARVVDDSYPLEDGSGYVYLDIKAGCQHLNGHFALAYARSRHQDDDYQRMRRQQAVLVALAHQVDPLALLPKFPDLLGIARDNLWMTIPREDIRSLAALAARVQPGSVRTIQFSPPTYSEFVTTREIAAIHDVTSSIFTEWSVSAAPKATAAPKACPAS